MKRVDWVYSLRKVLLILAVAGLLLSVSIHIATFFDTDIQRRSLLLRVLQTGIFPIFIGALLVVSRSDAYLQLKKHGAHRFKDLIHVIINPSPSWMKLITICFLLYALVNLVFFILLKVEGTVAAIAGNYVLIKNGDVVRELTKNEFLNQRSEQIRGLTGHWMFFYCLSATILFAQTKHTVR